MRLVYGKEMQALDRYTIEDFGIPGLILMENAGRGTAELIISRFAPEAQRGVLVVCGPGNNGGDGFVIARHLFQRGFPVKVLSLSPQEKFRGDAAVNFQIAAEMGLIAGFILEEKDLTLLEEALKECALVVDAIFGTGLTRQVEGRFAGAIERINQAGRPVVAVDIPSGLSADTGRPLGQAVKATLTATMALPKVGQVVYPGRELVGELEIIDISMPAKVIAQLAPPRFWLQQDWATGALKPRKPDTHKGTYGHLVVLAGSRGKTGAAILTCQGALRGGAGLVTLVCPQSLNPVFETTLTEAMTYPLPQETAHASLAQEAYQDIVLFCEGKKAVALGPGFGLHPDTLALSQKLVATLDLPMVIDADGISALAGEPFHLKRAPAPRVLTPHPGELARFLAINKEEIQKDRLAAARYTAQETGAVVVLKGAATVIAAPDGREAVNSSGNPGLASGGSGDVLTGLIGALLAQGYEAFVAACLGVFLHGLAADILAQRKGPYGYLAKEVAENIPAALKEITLRRNFFGSRDHL